MTTPRHVRTKNDTGSRHAGCQRGEGPWSPAAGITCEEMVRLLEAASPSFNLSRLRRAEKDLEARAGQVASAPGASDPLAACETFLAELSTHLVSLALAGRRGEFQLVFEVVEQLQRRGEDDVRSLATNILLLGLREGVALSGRDPQLVFRPWLGPTSVLAWDALDWLSPSGNGKAVSLDEQLAGLLDLLRLPD